MKIEILGYKINIEKKEIDNNDDMPEDLKEALKVLEKYGKKISATPAKIESAAKARQVREERTRQKVIKTINELKQKGEKITYYKVAKEAKISYIAARRHMQQLEKLNII